MFFIIRNEGNISSAAPSHALCDLYSLLVFSGSVHLTH